MLVKSGIIARRKILYAYSIFAVGHGENKFSKCPNKIHGQP